MKPKITAKNFNHLYTLVEKEIALHGYECDLNHINISKVKELAFLFQDSKFNGDISKWDTSNVSNMLNMFKNSEFNGDISNWNVSNVVYSGSMFANSKFNGDISNWDVQNLEDSNNMFANSEFNGDISKWKPYKLKNAHRIFSGTKVAPPYWANYEDIKQRIIAIDAYNLSIELNKTGTNQQSKKLKL